MKEDDSKTLLVTTLACISDTWEKQRKQKATLKKVSQRVEDLACAEERQKRRDFLLLLLPLLLYTG